MTVLADYTQEEQRVLLRSMSAAAVAISAASPGRGVETASEGVAAAEFVLGSEGDYLDNTLIGSILFELSRRARAEEPFPNFTDQAVAEDALPNALDALRAANTLLDAKSPPDEANEFRQWLMGIATHTAQAGKEGGNFLGWGGVQVNEAERDMLAQIAAILGIPA
jgi:hypothetical protein